ncbi:MAG: 2-succinyl-5-enolpyruvyl-6-hydroxy-3-cyclohexene-1-carboxylic-acid synthase [Cryomorphaceae bacterium]|jgi:2-succinyl-5-enolpyruvyl-6-hydroxy-3-cyclohexene-1-carboxylate synthase|nr:2-succinyl-5-enolpyruvyl-6-hydroxy-3-cyclohexene-1-carboxylic-acid synthase [Cryomorphaceae bacterium]
MISSDKETVQLLVEQCVSHGVKHVVCSPGSRNAPLVIAFDEHPEIECLVIHDERSAAFFALGITQQTNAPVAIVCTSGSAPLNYYPAVAEAYYQGLPLIVITADRPMEWTDQGDGQTIRQREVFQNHVRYSCNFTESTYHPDERWYIERETAIALSMANGQWKGPVHFNVALREPLYETQNVPSRFETRSIEMVNVGFAPDDTTLNLLLEGMSTTKKLVLVGQLPPDQSLLHELSLFAGDSSVAVLVENTSNLVGQKFIHCIDRALNTILPEQIEEYRPELLITLGGAVVSKRVKNFLRNHKPMMHWKVGFSFPYMDTYQALSHSFQVSPHEFFRTLNKLVYERSKSNFAGKWRQIDQLNKHKASEFLKSAPFSDLQIFHNALDVLPEGVHLHMGNSSVVRYCQLLDPIRSVTYWCNRGTSGIDGSTSTAVGAAFASPDQIHVLLTGDVSFFYDSNGLWNSYVGRNLRIILINNGGGGIFRIIPGPAQSPKLEKYFEARHDFTARGICDAYRLEYDFVTSNDNLESKLEKLFGEAVNGPYLLEVFTQDAENSQVLESFFKFIRL